MGADDGDVGAAGCALPCVVLVWGTFLGPFRAGAGLPAVEGPAEAVPVVASSNTISLTFSADGLICFPFDG